MKKMEADNFIKESNSAPFTEVPSEDFIDILLQGGGLADEAAYYLLHHRFGHRLKRRFEVYHNRLMDNYEDVVEDFFFYLREGKECENQSPYQSLRRIRKKGAFEGWLLNTFRNYLTSRAAAEEKYVSPGLLADCVTSTDAPDNLLTDERALSAAAHLIAYAHQTLNPHYRFVLLRALLTMLDPQQSLPNEAVAQALGMTGLSYRVTVHRAKCSLAKLRNRLLGGEELPLDDAHRQMARRINDDFTHLYPTLLDFYEQSIDTLQSAEAIRTLRQQYRESTGYTFHEPDVAYTARLSATGFWNKLNRWMI